LFSLKREFGYSIFNRIGSRFWLLSLVLLSAFINRNIKWSKRDVKFSWSDVKNIAGITVAFIHLNIIIFMCFLFEIYLVIFIACLLHFEIEQSRYRLLVHQSHWFNHFSRCNNNVRISRMMGMRGIRCGFALTTASLQRSSLEVQTVAVPSTKHWDVPCIQQARRRTTEIKWKTI
jgi:hypothetical protein